MQRRYSIPLLILLTILTSVLIKISPKNTCRNYFDYLLINFGGDCYYNPDVDLSVPEIIKKYTGNVETYNLTTEDGYLLTMFRIPRTNPLGVILLQPPMSTGSMAYLSDSKNSLGIALWEKGYDVWLSNHRGVSYSRGHVNLSETDPEFWNYGFHEIALYDLEVQFKTIKKETKSKIIYIAYSLGSTAALIYSSLKPDSAENFIEKFVLMAPLVRLDHFTSPFKYIFYAGSFFNMETGEFLTGELIRRFGQVVTAVPYVVNIMTSVIMGWTPNEMDPEQNPYVFVHHGRGISNQMVNHYGQIVKNGSHFCMYDYGEERNKLKYQSNFPPEYQLQNIRNSIYIIYGDKDTVATPLDIKILTEELLPKKSVAGVFPIENHNHVDFMFSRHRRKKTYQILSEILDEIRSLKKKNKKPGNFMRLFKKTMDNVRLVHTLVT